MKGSIGAHSAVETRYQFGETNVQGRISRCGDELARTALYEAANLLLIRSTKWFCVAGLGHAGCQTPQHGTPRASWVAGFLIELASPGVLKTSDTGEKLRVCRGDCLIAEEHKH
jgi:hypothetical protein